MIRIIQGDCRDVLRTLPDAGVDSIVTDPPYELGFMGKAWDKSGIANDAALWRECLRVAKPGAYLLAFGGTRTFHRLACAIEDAGWEVRDTLMWVYGSGFPKSHNGPWGGTALKPAWEPIIMARKPLIGTVEANWREHGTGALNIDGCRVSYEADCRLLKGGSYGGNRTGSAGASVFGTGEGHVSYEGNLPTGRWPANLIHDGSEEVLSCFPDAPGQQGDLTGNEPSSPFKNAYGVMGRAPAAQARGDAGSAARFFYCAKASREDRNIGCDGLPEKPLNWSSGEQSPGTFQSPRTNRSASNHHPTVKPTELMRWLVRLVTPKGGTVLDPFAGSGSTGRAADIEGCNAILIELNPEYVAIARKRIHGDAPLFAEVT
jgi:site-specific DNA-methyltransferase (adenine-specific)